MKTVKQITSIFLLTSILFLSSCSGEDGEDGLTGPQGEQGVQGVDGADGADGEDGDTGTANVIYSDWIDSPFSSGNIIQTNINEDIDVPGLSQQIVDEGVVLVYGKGELSSNVYSLPFVGSAGVSYYYYHDVEIINLRLSKIDGSTIGTPAFSFYRYVLIPGEVPASNGLGGISSKKYTLDYSKMSYEEVIEHFNIPE